MHIYQNKLINNIIIKLIPNDYRDDFKSHFYLQILEHDNIKLNYLFERGALNWFCIAIIKNQRGNKSSFWKTYRNSGTYNSGDILDVVDITDWFEITDETDNEWEELCEELLTYIDDRAMTELKASLVIVIRLMQEITDPNPAKIISEKTKVPYSTIKRYALEAKKHIYNKIPEDLKQRYINYIYKTNNIKYVNQLPFDHS